MDPTWTLGAAISNKARVRFLPMGGTAVPVREEIGDSSRRSLTSGVQPDQLDVPYDPTRTRGNRLETAARPVLDQLADDLADSRMSVLLTDERGHVVDRRVSEPSLRAQLDRINIAPGSGDRGDHAGTNAIRTALARHLASVVDRGEHLVEPLTGMAFASAPVTDPHQRASPGGIHPRLRDHGKRLRWLVPHRGRMAVGELLPVARPRHNQDLAVTRPSRRGTRRVKPPICAGRHVARARRDPIPRSQR